MMFSFRRRANPWLTLPALGMLFLFFRGDVAAETVVYPVPTPPAGVNPATYPMFREEWFVKFQDNLEKTKGQKFDLLFDGDSITDFWQTRGKEVWEQHYGKLNAVDFGISGDMTQNVLWRLQQGQVDGMDPKLIVLMIGTNNITKDKDTPDQIADGIKAVVAEYLKRCPNSHLLLLGVFPRAEKPTDELRAKVMAINEKIASLDDGKRVTYLDIGKKFLQPDGTLTKEVTVDFLHPNPKGYAIWADAIQPIVDQYCPASAVTPHAPTPADTTTTPVLSPKIRRFGNNSIETVYTMAFYDAPS